MMIPIEAFLADLNQKKIKLWLEEDNLRVNAPKGALTRALRQQLVARKAEISSFLRPVTSLPTVKAAPEERYEPFPLTDVQYAYWLGRHSTFELGNVSTHGYLELENPNLDLLRLTEAFQRVIERHDMLRAIVLPSGQQQILESKNLPPYQIAVLDLTELAEDAVHDGLMSVRDEMSHQVLKADQWPLFDIRTTRYDGQTRLHLSFDALIIDGLSMNMIFTEWATLYQNPKTLLPPLELSYRDYLLAEKALEETDLYRRSEQYWLNRLDTLPPAPKLPFAQDPSTLIQPRFARRLAMLEPPLWQAIKTRAAKANLAPANVVLAAFAEILTVWSKTPRFTLNQTLFNRLPLHPQVKKIVGDFTTLMLSEIDNSQPESFLARATRIQELLWQDLEHRYFSGVRVLRELAKRQPASGSALMPIVFTNLLAMKEEVVLGGEDSPDAVLGENIYTISQTSQVYLDHMLSEWQGHLIYNWDAVQELFPAGMLDDMFAAYGAFLERLATDEAAWSEPHSQLVPSAQLKQREAVNATEAPISSKLLHTLFIAQVEAHYDDVAVIAPQRTLTYGELYQQASQIGHSLREKGAKPNTLVAVVMEKGWEQVVAVLGILISGAAYLPIDPALPTERQHYLLEQAEATLALTQSHLEQKLTWPKNVERLSVDEGRLKLSQQTIAPSQFEPVQTPTDLAYVIYTSGSTGLPKGVVIDHRGAVNTVLDINQRFEVTAQDRVLALSALNFDLSVYDIFGLLAVGGTIVMPAEEGRRDPSHWAALMEQHGVTFWDTVPALMQMLVEYQAERPLNAPLRLVMMSGDWIPLTLPDRIRALWPNAQLFSLGGATEASIWSIFYPIGEIDPTWKSVPYGKPMINQSWHVLNEQLEPCPVWVPGDLYIGGIGLALGYWRDEKKTNASFITHPRTGERLYKTGDLGRYILSGEKDLGNIEFLGREDFQVKVRGHRIELGEIEANLVRHPAIKEAVVTAVGEQRGDKQLVAYIVADATINQQLSASKQVDQAAYGDTTGTLSDAIERTAFKLKQPGIRQLDEGTLSLPKGQSVVQFERPALEEDQAAAYLRRQSYRQFLNEPLPLANLGEWLRCLSPHSFGQAHLPKYRYGSAGSLYPVQTYLYIKPNRVAGLAGGTYYYHPTEYQLIPLSPTAHIPPDLHGGPNREMFEQSAFSLFLVGELAAIEPMYGAAARDFCLLEAGYMSQLLMEEAPESEIGLCPVGGLDFAPLRAEFQLAESQLLLHSFVGGAISPEQMKRLPQPEGAPRSLEDEIKAYLGEKVPDYMVPNFYVSLEALPLTANGKVNRKALPVPDISAFKEDVVVPENEIEEKLAAIVRDALSLTQISVTTNFFDLGANSVLMIQIYNQLQQAFKNKKLSIMDLFRLATVRSLAEHLAQTQPKAAPTSKEAQQRGQARLSARRGSRSRRRRR